MPSAIHFFDRFSTKSDAVLFSAAVISGCVIQLILRGMLDVSAARVHRWLRGGRSPSQDNSPLGPLVVWPVGESESTTFIAFSLP